MQQHLEITAAAPADAEATHDTRLLGATPPSRPRTRPGTIIGSTMPPPPRGIFE